MEVGGGGGGGYDGDVTVEAIAPLNRLQGCRNAHITRMCTHTQKRTHTHTCTCTYSLPKLVTWVSPGEGTETQKESWKDDSIDH